jgi:hypothetical protein
MINQLKNNRCHLCGSKLLIDESSIINSETFNFACSNQDCKFAIGYNEYIKILKEEEIKKRIEYKKMLED